MAGTVHEHGARRSIHQASHCPPGAQSPPWDTHTQCVQMPAVNSVGPGPRAGLRGACGLAPVQGCPGPTEWEHPGPLASDRRRNTVCSRARPPKGFWFRMSRRRLAWTGRRLQVRPVQPRGSRFTVQRQKGQKSRGKWALVQVQVSSRGHRNRPFSGHALCRQSAATSIHTGAIWMQCPGWSLVRPAPTPSPSAMWCRTPSGRCTSGTPPAWPWDRVGAACFRSRPFPGRAAVQVQPRGVAGVGA